MKTLKVLLQEVVSGIKAWVNSNFAQESNTVHKTGNETVNGNKTFTGNVIQNQAGGVNVYCATCDGAVKGDLTSSGMFSIVCKDGSSANMETSGLAAVYMGQDTSGSYVALRADTSYNNTRYNASVSLDIDPTTANNNAIFRPRRDNTIDLGSSSYQFKNTYTKNLYVDETLTFNKLSYPDGITGINDNTIVFPRLGTTIFFNTRGSSNYQSYGTFLYAGYESGSESPYRYGQLFLLRSTDKRGEANDGFIPDTTFKMWRVSPSYYNMEFMESVRIRNLATAGANYMIPLVNNATDLGISTNKWKSFNGVNPGALSLPNFSAEYNVSGEIVPPEGENAININGGDNYFTPTVSGWLSVRMHYATAISICRSTRSSYRALTINPSEGDIGVCSPVVAGVTYTIKINASKWDDSGNNYDHFRLAPCLGNVTSTSQQGS